MQETNAPSSASKVFAKTVFRQIVYRSPPTSAVALGFHHLPPPASAVVCGLPPSSAVVRGLPPRHLFKFRKFKQACAKPRHFARRVHLIELRCVGPHTQRVSCTALATTPARDEMAERQGGLRWRTRSCEDLMCQRMHTCLSRGRQQILTKDLLLGRLALHLDGDEPSLTLRRV